MHKNRKDVILIEQLAFYCALNCTSFLSNRLDTIQRKDLYIIKVLGSTIYHVSIVI